MRRDYSTDEGKKLSGVMVVCDEKSCDGIKPGHGGFCVPVEKTPL